jgi:predicted dehydrogenase
MVGWGIAGCGWVARDFGAPAIAASGNGRLVALYDPDPASLERIAADDKMVKRETSLDAFLHTPGLDAVYVAAPNHVHRTLVEAASAAGLAVLCEKPMALDAEDARAMVSSCARHGVFYATAFDQRFHAAHRHAARMIAEDAIGRVTALRIVYACWVGSSWSDDNWRIDPSRAGGGAMFDLAPHGLDLAAMLLGEKLDTAYVLGQRRVQDYARAGGVDDGAIIAARTASGVLVQLHVAYNCPEFLPRRRLEIVGDRGQITMTDTMGQTPGGSLRLQTADGPAREIEVEGIGNSPFAAQIAAFGDHLLGVRPFGFTAEQDIRTMILLAELRDAIASDDGKH